MKPFAKITKINEDCQVMVHTNPNSSIVISGATTFNDNDEYKHQFSNIIFSPAAALAILNLLQDWKNENKE